jgi:hypothetical protein
VFDELLQLTSPAPPAAYRGFPVERYQSYAIRSTMLDDLRPLRVPIFVAQGTRDRNTPVAGADLLAVELLRSDPQRAVRYLILPGLDHGFCDGAGSDHQGEVLHAFLDFAARPTRSVVTLGLGPPTARATRIRFFGVDVRIWAGLLALTVALVVARRLARRQRAPAA